MHCHLNFLMKCSFWRQLELWGWYLFLRIRLQIVLSCMHGVKLSVLLYDQTFLWQLEFLAWQNILMPLECILLCQACIMCTIYLFRDAKFSLLSMTILSLFHWIVHYLFYQACKIFLFHSMWIIYFCFNWIAVCLLNTYGLFCLIFSRKILLEAVAILSFSKYSWPIGLQIVLVGMHGMHLCSYYWESDSKLFCQA